VGLRYKNGDEVTDSIGLFISILVRYPEVGTIYYEPQSHLLRFAFTLSKILDRESWENFSQRIVSCLETYNYLEGRTHPIIHLSHSVYESITQIEIQRDVETLTSEEIAMLISLVHQNFSSILVTDENYTLLEEDLMLQEELIGHMLEGMKGAIPERKIIALREEGRVLVFNK